MKNGDFRIVEYSGKFRIERFISGEWRDVDIYGNRNRSDSGGNLLTIPERKHKTLVKARARIEEMKRGEIIHTP